MPKTARNIIGPQVRRFRVQQNLSQSELAVRLQLAGLDWGRVALAKIEGQIKKVSDAEIYVIARVLGVQIDTLFPEEERVKEFLSLL
ncbi:MAG: helix-turn-helix transcriptional regulator [Verrucomicrobiota bacterium]